MADQPQSLMIKVCFCNYKYTTIKVRVCEKGSKGYGKWVGRRRRDERGSWRIGRLELEREAEDLYISEGERTFFAMNAPRVELIGTTLDRAVSRRQPNKG